MSEVLEEGMVTVFFCQKGENSKKEGVQDNLCWGCGEQDKTDVGSPVVFINCSDVGLQFCPKCWTSILEQGLRLQLRAIGGKEPDWPIRKLRRLDEDEESLPPAPRVSE